MAEPVIGIPGVASIGRSHLRIDVHDRRLRRFRATSGAARTERYGGFRPGSVPFLAALSLWRPRELPHGAMRQSRASSPPISLRESARRPAKSVPYAVHRRGRATGWILSIPGCLLRGENPSCACRYQASDRIAGATGECLPGVGRYRHGGCHKPGEALEEIARGAMTVTQAVCAKDPLAGPAGLCQPCRPSRNEGYCLLLHGLPCLNSPSRFWKAHRRAFRNPRGQGSRSVRHLPGGVFERSGT